MANYNEVNKARQGARKMADENAALREAVKKLNSEMKKLRAENERLQEMAGNLAKQTGDNAVRVAELRAVLHDLEWISVAEDPDREIWRRCPSCDAWQEYGHYSGCNLAAALEN